jgi:hypothetical protein
MPVGEDILVEDGLAIVNSEPCLLTKDVID